MMTPEENAQFLKNLKTFKKKDSNKVENFILSVGLYTKRKKGEKECQKDTK